MNFVKRAWRGEEKLWKIFWIFGVAFGFAYNYLLSLFSGGAVFWALVALFIVYDIWLSVALWRCAFNSGLKIWGYIARIIAVILIIMYIGAAAATVFGGKQIAVLDECQKQMETEARAQNVELQTYIHQHINECFAAKGSEMRLTSLPAGGQAYVAECESDFMKQNPGKDPKPYFALNQQQLKSCVEFKMKADKEGKYPISLPDDVAKSPYVTSCIEQLIKHAKANGQDPRTYVRENNSWVIQCVKAQKSSAGVQ